MNGLNLLVLRCSDIDATRRFYECLGMSFTTHSHGSGARHHASENAEGAFELYPAGPAQPKDGTGLGFSVKNAETARRMFEACGFEPEPIREQPWGRTFVVRDPDGRRVEIKEQ